MPPLSPSFRWWRKLVASAACAAALWRAPVPAAGFGLSSGGRVLALAHGGPRTTTTITTPGASWPHRCGASPLRAGPDPAAPPSANPKVAARGKWLAAAGAVSGLGLVLWKKAALLSLMATLRDDWLLAALDALGAAGTPGLVAYSALFLVWEMTLGITTPVETAAGMAFGVKGGILASGAGKIGGAFVAFWLARHSFKDTVREKIEGNELLGLMEESIREHPLRVALLCRFSPLPELAKNAGMGVMPVPARAFLASLLLHGLSFTCLWTCTGAETARVLRGLPPSATLKRLLAGATWIGFGAPVLIGLWIKSLREQQQARHAATEETPEEEAKEEDDDNDNDDE